MWLVRSKDKVIHFAADTQIQAVRWGARNMGYARYAPYGATFPECIFDFQVVSMNAGQEGEEPEDYRAYVDWELDDNEEADSFQVIVVCNNATVLKEDFALRSAP